MYTTSFSKPMGELCVYTEAYLVFKVNDAFKHTNSRVVAK